MYGSSDDIYGSQRSLALHSSHPSILQIKPPKASQGLNSSHPSIMQIQPSPRQHSNTSKPDPPTVMLVAPTPRQNAETTIANKDSSKSDTNRDGVIKNPVENHFDTENKHRPINIIQTDNLLGGKTLPKHIHTTPEETFVDEVQKKRGKTVVLSTGQHVTFIPRRQVRVSFPFYEIFAFCQNTADQACALEQKFVIQGTEKISISQKLLEKLLECRH